MALDFSIQPPQWLTRQSEWAKGTGERGTESFMRGVQFFTNQKKENLNMASAALRIEAEHQAFDLQAIELKNIAEDTATIPAYLREHSTPESRWSSSPPVAKSAKWQQAISRITESDSKSLQVQTAKDAIKSFEARVNALRIKDPFLAGDFYKDIGKVPSPERLKTLSLAEQAAEEAKKTERATEEAKAEVRGDAVTTTVTDKGVTKTYKPAALSGVATMPKEAMLSDGSKIVVNPKTGAFKFMAKDGKEKEFTRPQLLAIAKHLESIDAEDVNAKKITEFLASGAVEQIQKPEPVKPAANQSETKSGLRYQVVPVP